MCILFCARHIGVLKALLQGWPDCILHLACSKLVLDSKNGNTIYLKVLESVFLLQSAVHSLCFTVTHFRRTYNPSHKRMFLQKVEKEALLRDCFSR